MKSWHVHEGGKRTLVDLDVGGPERGGVIVEMQAAPVLSYLRDVLEGKAGYRLPPVPFTPGTNGAGVVRRVGRGVYHLVAGDRVLIDPHLVVDERVREPAQILIGLTATGSSRFGGVADAALALQADWPNGTFAEVVHVPAAVVTKMTQALDVIPAERLVGLSKFAVPYGGFRRAELRAGETVIVNGATGYFGSAAAILALALGASRVVAAGRDGKPLEQLREAGGARLVTVELSGAAEKDATSLAEAAGGRADMAIDLVGRATDAESTVATLHALRRGGRLVVMGSMSAPLPLAVGEMLANDWHVMGNFMYPADSVTDLATLVASGQLDLGQIRLRTFALGDLEAALEAAASMRGLDMTVLTMNR